MLWDESADDLILGGAAGLSVNSTALVTGVLTTTAATVSPSTNTDLGGASIFYRQNINKMSIGTEVAGGVFAIRSGAGTEAINIDSTGAVTMPAQPAFSVNKGGTAQEDIAIGTDVTITFDTERFDNNADFDLGANSFTAPVTGKYMLSLNIRLENVDSAATYYIPTIITSNALYRFIFDPDFGQDANYWNVAFSVLADMDASDTAYVAYNQGGGTAQTDVSGDDDYTFFTGYLAC
jgi:hypothetical protein